jgi:hypothetical protein
MDLDGRHQLPVAIRVVQCTTLAWPDEQYHILIMLRFLLEIRRSADSISAVKPGFIQQTFLLGF